MTTNEPSQIRKRIGSPHGGVHRAALRHGTLRGFANNKRLRHVPGPKCTSGRVHFGPLSRAATPWWVFRLILNIDFGGT